MRLGMANAVVAVALVAVQSDQASAQQHVQAESFEARALRVFDDHMRCAGDITATRSFMKSARPDVLPKFDDATKSYFDRLYGVGEAVGRTHGEVTKAILDQQRSHIAYLKDPSTKMDDAQREIASRVERAKVCFRAIGFTIN